MMDRERYIQKISSLILKSLRGELTDQEESKLAEWRQARKENDQLFQNVAVLWSNQEEKSELLMIDAYQRYQKAIQRQDWEQIKQRVQLRQRKRILKRCLSYAAVVTLLLGICVVVWWYIPESSQPLVQSQGIVHNTTRAILKLPQGIQIALNEPQKSDTALLQQYGITHQDTLLSYESVKTKTEWHTLEVPRGGEYLLTLVDGSRVWINAESKLRFPTCFEGNERRVCLEEGEAYFIVAENKTQPFYVEVGDMQVKVLGTEFNVMAYPEKPIIATTLVKGAVQLIAPQMTFQMTSNDQALFERETGLLTCRQVDVNYYISWKNGVFEFKGMPLKEVAMVLSRWYDVDFIFEHSALEQEYFTGAIQRNKSLEFILNIIQETRMIDYKIVNRTVIFSKK